jgi:hypothetical protein
VKDETVDPFREEFDVINPEELPAPEIDCKYFFLTKNLR